MSEPNHSDSGDPNRERRKRDKLLELGKRLISSKHMLWGIGLASFLEAIIVPIPLETILIPLLQARRKQMFLISTIVLLTCLLAAFIGYCVGYYVFDLIGDQLVSLVASQEQYEEVREKMRRNGFWFIFSVGVIPIPFQIAMLAAGVTQYSLVLFLAASALSRGIRYYGLAVLVYFTGNQAQKVFERHKLTASIAMLAIIGIAWGFALFG